MGRGMIGTCPACDAFFRPCRDSWRWGHVARAYPRMNPWAIACRLSEAGVGGVSLRCLRSCQDLGACGIDGRISARVVRDGMMITHSHYTEPNDTSKIHCRGDMHGADMPRRDWCFGMALLTVRKRPSGAQPKVVCEFSSSFGSQDAVERCLALSRFAFDRASGNPTR
jgi:hypothetical protein